MYREIYDQIMEDYHNGKYGTEHLTLNELLTKAGYPDLLSQLSIGDLVDLHNASTGQYKQIFKTELNKRYAKCRYANLDPVEVTKQKQLYAIRKILESGRKKSKKE